MPDWNRNLLTDELEWGNTIAFQSINTLAVETSLFRDGSGNDRIARVSGIPANDPSPGVVYVLTMGGVYGTKTAPVGNITFRMRYGTSTAGTSLGSWSTPPTAGLTNTLWWAEIRLVIRAIGTSGEVQCGGHFFLGTTTTSQLIPTAGNAPVVTVNTTVDAGLWPGVTWATSSASNTITCQWASFRCEG